MTSGAWVKVIASELKPLVQTTFLAGRMYRGWRLMYILSLLRFTAKLEAATHLGVLISLDSRRLLECLCLLFHASLLLFALPACSSTWTTVLVEERRIRIHNSKVSFTQTRRRPYQLEIFKFEALDK
jgi:hypothetical protein